MFGGFSGTTRLSDFPWPFIAVVFLADSQRRPWPISTANHGTSRVPCKEFLCVQQGLRPRGTRAHLAITMREMWPSACLESVGVPKSVAFRGSIPGPHVPLPTLRPCPYGQRRTARGQSGSLLFLCMALASTSPRQLSRRTPAHYRLERAHPWPGRFRTCGTANEISWSHRNSSNPNRLAVPGRTLSPTRAIQSPRNRFISSTDD